MSHNTMKKRKIRHITVHNGRNAMHGEGGSQCYRAYGRSQSYRAWKTRVN